MEISGCGHFVEYEECYNVLFQKQYGFYRPVISHVVNKYLECGDLRQGFASHLHALVADGLFFESGYFFVMPRLDLLSLRELFRAYVLKVLKKEGLIDDTFIQMVLKWRHISGFSAHNEVCIKPNDEKGIENLSQYIIRNTFSLEKLKYDGSDSSVIYRSKMTHGKNKRNFQVFTPMIS